MAIHFYNELHLYIQNSKNFICNIIERQYSLQKTPRIFGGFLER